MNSVSSLLVLTVETATKPRENAWGPQIERELALTTRTRPEVWRICSSSFGVVLGTLKPFNQPKPNSPAFFHTFVLLVHSHHPSASLPTASQRVKHRNGILREKSSCRTRFTTRSSVSVISSSNCLWLVPIHCLQRSSILSSPPIHQETVWNTESNPRVVSP